MLLVLAATLTVRAETVFGNLAADAKGTLYMNSSLVLQGEEGRQPGNVFRYQKYVGWMRFAPGWGPVRGRIDVSADGIVFAATEEKTELRCRATFSVPSGSYCYNEVVVKGTLESPQYRIDAFPGWVQVSRNGHYALFTGGGNTLLDLTTGSTRSIKELPAAWRFAAADNGCALMRGSAGDRLVLDCPDGERRFESLGSVETATIDRGARRIVYGFQRSSKESNRVGLRTINVSTGEDILLAEREYRWGLPSDPQLSQYAVSGDGRQIVYLWAPSGDDPSVPQVFAVEGDGANRRQLTGGRFPEGFSELTISPDGGTAYAVSAWNRVVRIDLQSGEAAEILPRTPVVSGYGCGRYGMAPGSLAVIWGSGMSEGSHGAGVRVAGLDAPIVSARPDEILYQVPFEAQPGPVEILLSNPSPFVSAVATPPCPVVDWNLKFLPWGGSRVFHKNLRDVVSRAEPARPGETVHVYAAGLGPVSPPVRTGEAGPADPPALVTTPLRCMLEDRPLEVVFAGLAPGMTATYRISLKMPKAFDVETGYRTLRCDTPGKPPDYGDTVGIAVSNQR